MDLNELIELESKTNQPIGVECVKYIIKCLKNGNIDGAKLTRQWDLDKIRYYPEIEAWLDDNLCDWRGNEPTHPDHKKPLFSQLNKKG